MVATFRPLLKLLAKETRMCEARIFVEHSHTSLFLITTRHRSFAMLDSSQNSIVMKRHITLQSPKKQKGSAT